MNRFAIRIKKTLNVQIDATRFLFSLNVWLWDLLAIDRFDFVDFPHGSGIFCSMLARFFFFEWRSIHIIRPKNTARRKKPLHWKMKIAIEFLAVKCYLSICFSFFFLLSPYSFFFRFRLTILSVSFLFFSFFNVNRTFCYFNCVNLYKCKWNITWYGDDCVTLAHLFSLTAATERNDVIRFHFAAIFLFSFTDDIFRISYFLTISVASVGMCVCFL